MAKRAFDHIVENIRYSRYWYGTPDLGNGYVEGKQISALIFWTKADRQSKVGICSPELAYCLATSGETISPEMDQMPTDRSLTAKAAFESFIEDGIDVGGKRLREVISQAHPLPSRKTLSTPNTNSSVPTISSDLTGLNLPVSKRLSLTDFEFAEKTVTLPSLGLPTALSRREVPKDAASKAARIKQYFNCWGEGFKRPSGCTGTLVFAYYHETYPNWIVLRTCSSACRPMVQGDSIQFLRREDDGEWMATGGGHYSSPADVVERFRQKIEQVEMFRFQIP